MLTAVSRAALLALALFILGHSAVAQERGRFTGELVLKVLGDGINMQITEPFAYTDSKGIRWQVPSGTRIDGASIPRSLWSIVGSPFTGLYLEASVVHDHYCETKSRHWKAVHKVFYEAMLARGVNEYQAKLMYAAVYRFGPRWNYDANACFCLGCPACANPKITKIKHLKPVYSKHDFDKLKELIDSSSNSLEQIEATADYQINTTLFK